MRRWLSAAGCRSSCSTHCYQEASRRVPVSASAGGNGASDASHSRLGGRALSAVSGARLLSFSKLSTQLGGTLVVDDAAHKQAVQKAVQDGTISFGFSAGGCLFPYYIGCAGALMDGGILTDSVKIGGASAGSLLAACIKSGMPLEQLVETNMRLMDNLRRGGTRGRLGPVLAEFLERHLPEDAHERCRDKAYVAVTRVTPIARPSLVSRFHDRPDLIRALMTSCHIPLWMDGSLFTEFRGERHCDGGLTNFLPLPPDTLGIRVCCFPSQQLSPVYRIGISPDSFEPWNYSLRQMLQWAFEPADEATVAALIEKGKRDAEAWMKSMELVGERAAVQSKAEQQVGRVAAAKAAAVGSEDADAQQRAQHAGEAHLDARAWQGADAEMPARPAAAVGAPAVEHEGRRADGDADVQRQAVEAAARLQDARASQEEQETAARRALEEAEAQEGEGGNLWARALSAAGVAASAAAVAAAVTRGLAL